MKWLKILFLLFTLRSALSLDIELYSIDFYIQPDMSVREEIKIVFSSPISERNITHTITSQISDISANNTFELLKVTFKNGKITIFLPNQTKEVYLSFKTSDLVYDYNGGKEFLVYVSPPEANKTKFKVWLPKGYVMFKGSMMPQGKVGSDGEKIFVSWEGKGDTTLMVRFYQPSGSKLELLLALLLALTAIILIIKSLKSEDYLLGFSNDEVKVIEAIREKKIVYQNKLERELGFSRVKMTRIVKKLEEKGLIKKEKIGRTNKLTWV
ncbi:MAG: hypothetical protein QXO84_01795 [Candidatus Aenigmatarchaeota archaeon]